MKMDRSCSAARGIDRKMLQQHQRVLPLSQKPFGMEFLLKRPDG
jgi:hypothetical protein